MSAVHGESIESIPPLDLLWALGSLCALHGLTFDAQLVAREFPPPTTVATLVAAGRAAGLRIKPVAVSVRKVPRLTLPLLVLLHPQDQPAVLALVTTASTDQVVVFRAGTNTAQTLSLAEFEREFTAGGPRGTAWLTAPQAARVKLLVASSSGQRPVIAPRDRSGDHLRSFWVEGDGRYVRPVARGA